MTLDDLGIWAETTFMTGRAWFPKGKQTIGDHLFDQSPSWPLWSWQIIYIYNLRWIRNRMTLDDLGIWAETTFMTGRAWFPKGKQTIGDHLFDQSPSWPLWSWQIIYIYNLRWIRNRMTLDDLGIWAETTFMNGRSSLGLIPKRETNHRRPSFRSITFLTPLILTNHIYL